MLYRINNFSKLGTASHLVWDIDGTITDEHGQLSQEIAAKLIGLARMGIYHSFITGRDALWIIEKVIEPLKQFYNFPSVRDHFVFYAEVGCIALRVGEDGGVVQVEAEEIKNHSLKCDKQLRQMLRELAYHPVDPGLATQGDGAVERCDRPTQFDPFVLYDANDRAWRRAPGQKEPLCPPYIWSDTKQVFATLEKVRDEEGDVGRPFDTAPFEQAVRRTIATAGFDSVVDIEAISTAINIVPKVNGLKLGKSWAAGKAILHVWHLKLGQGVPLDQVIARTLAFGDGKADLDFTSPIFPTSVMQRLDKPALQIVFVGGEDDLPAAGSPESALCGNIIIQATGLGDLSVNYHKRYIHLQEGRGARVVSEALDFLKLWDYFQKF